MECPAILNSRSLQLTQDMLLRQCRTKKATLNSVNLFLIILRCCHLGHVQKQSKTLIAKFAVGIGRFQRNRQTSSHTSLTPFGTRRGFMDAK